MPSSPRRARLTLALIGALIAFAAAPSVAAADLTISSATIDGSANSSSSPPGGVLPATVTGSGGGDQWGGTQCRFGSDAKECVNTNNTSGSQTVKFNVTAPGQPGSYDAGVS